jgi:hypothetical protein
MGKATQTDMDGKSGRLFREQHQWCWNVEPAFVVTGELFNEIQLDGTYLKGGWCLLTAINGEGKVVNRQWCNHESTAAWKALISPLPPPKVVVCDGGSGLPAALAELWPDTKVQRCLVHIQRNVQTHITTNPRSDAGKGLRKLSLTLTRVNTQEKASAWLVALNDWHQQFGSLLKERTYLDTPGVLRPTWAKVNAKWWYTHYRLRRAYGLLERLAKSGELFTFLAEEYDGLGISSTTNKIEGGTNGSMKWVLRHHRGMPIEHRRRALDWWCYEHSLAPKSPASLIKPEHWQPLRKSNIIEQETPGDMGTGFNALTRNHEPSMEPIPDDDKPDIEPGISIRKGWAGRSN